MWPQPGSWGAVQLRFADGIGLAMAETIELLNIAVRERVGLAAYWILGR